MSSIRRRVFKSVEAGRDVICVDQSQNCSEIIQVNHENMMANGFGTSTFWKGREWVKVATIPNVLIDQWHKQGLNFYDHGDWQILKRLLNDSEFSKLRTAPGRF